MVWGFFPVESLPGEQSYYLFSKGTYKIGRKGCDVIINTDKGVSRVHAEVIIDSMTSLDPLQRRTTTSFNSNVRIKDLSKYGTFINKRVGGKCKVSEYPNKEAPLKDGDLLSFGTGNATYRFSYVPLIFFVQTSTANVMEDISLIGARATRSWSAECTHVLVDESTPITEDLVDAIVEQKPIILKSWLEVVAEKNIRTELPSCDNCIPTLKLEGLPVKIVMPKLRENCLADYKFLLGSLDLYKFGDKLQSLLGAGGANVLSVDSFCSSSEMSEDRANIRLVLVNLPGQASHFDNMKQLRSTSRINEASLISAVLSGHLDQSILESPPIMVSSSCSTDETIVEDSDVEMDAVSSHPSVQNIKLEEETLKDIPEEEHGIEAEHIESEKVETMSPEVDDRGMMGKTVNVNKSETQSDDSADVIYCQNLIVRDTNAVAPVHSRNKGVVNFKCFKKRDTPSGNSFKNLVPFARDPYRESERENDDVAEHVREEKKRKQLEAMAEDLFNNDRSKRSKAGNTSVRGILSRS